MSADDYSLAVFLWLGAAVAYLTLFFSHEED